MAFVDYQKKDNIVTITINRPDRLNALCLEVVAELRDAREKFEGDPEARVAIITGSGRAFSAGLDIKEFTAPDQPGVMGVVKKEGFEDAPQIGGWSKVAKPVIAAVNGFALGGGCFLAIACDIRIAAASATFGMPEITLGLWGTPDEFIVQGIPACIAMELALTGERITAQRAYEIGLVNKVVPDKELMPTALKVAERIAELPPLAVRLNKLVAQKALEVSREIWDLRYKIEIELLNSEDYHEAAKAFVEKRKPVFKGR